MSSEEVEEGNYCAIIKALTDPIATKLSETVEISDITDSDNNFEKDLINDCADSHESSTMGNLQRKKMMEKEYESTTSWKGEILRKAHLTQI
jgi:hypothetical protein